MSVELVGRVLQRMKELGMNPRSASLASGLNATAIRDLVQKPGLSPKLETVAKLATGLKTTPEWLAYGSGEMPSELTNPPAGISPASSQVGDVVEAAKRKIVRAAYGGAVDAGSFRPADEFEDDPDRPPMFEPVDPDYPFAEVVIFDVMGDSMNDLKPRPIMSGDKLVCLSFASLKGRVELRDRMVVVVEQKMNDGQFRGRSVKQVEVYRDRYEFHPRSTNPKHKPIVIMEDVTADDGQEFQILALVRSLKNPMPGW